ncbi:MAG: von Willebrand factor type A domain-containing protein, partial [Clostridia bacterium]|nr:von Willebrand factor type A domain-containing protein [Clostridia bacterium]
MKKFIAIAAAALCTACLTFTACSMGAKGDYWNGNTVPPAGLPDTGADASSPNYDYNPIIETDFQEVSKAPSSYFSLDKNTATYSLVRKQINAGYTIFPDSIRIEEMINYFDYDFAAPTDKAVKVSGYLSDCPWNSENKLLLAGIRTAEYKVDTAVNNYVFLIDVSGSMQGKDRIDLAKYGLKKLVDSLGENDMVSIVTYASGVNTVLDSGECSPLNKENIKAKIDGLVARGATNGGDGLQRAYNLAQKNFRQGGNNRVILISDGDFNVGMTSQTELKEFIQDKADTGVYLSVLGVGLGNMRDTTLETLATCGNGNYAYLDTKTEAEKVMVEELGGLLKTVAKDAKAGVTFTDSVEKYRLIG